ncbi:GNAT family N-acetyltransferase [Salinactinospora qingdaonensis]|uniref:GNAT family N-acetyltransferase n=1 Tax=Salinactinospora qingdaonensis TaxID=702744 RepID=A0ABP7GCC5_9ACTN
MRLFLISVPWDDPRGARLRCAHEKEMVRRYGADFEAGPAPSAADVDAFLIAVEGQSGQALGCGALRGLDPGAAEVKRMYVVPSWRGRRLGEHLLRRLETVAVESGATRMLLETGARQPESIRLYERCGYRRVANFGPYVDRAGSLCYERALVPVTPTTTV